MNQQYKNSLCLLCRESAFLEQMKKRHMAGEPVSQQEMGEHLQLIVRAKEKFLEAKEALGYDDGLEFMENSNFYGFCIKDGCVEGSLENIPKIALPFMQDEEEHFKYEVGVLLLSHYFMQRGEYYGAEQMLSKDDGDMSNKHTKWYSKFLHKVKRMITSIVSLLRSNSDDINQEDWDE